MAKSKAKSTAQKVDASFKALCELRKKFNFPEITHEKDVNEAWQVGYNMTLSAMSDVKRHAQEVRTALGFIPWRHDPNK